LTITYGDGSTQTESIVEVPNIAKNTITTYEMINLRNNGGTEKEVSTESFSAGTPLANGRTMPFSGGHRSYTITIALPGGSTETESETEIITGPKAVVNGKITKPNGGVEKWNAVKITAGPTTVSNKTITEPNGSIDLGRPDYRIEHIDHGTQRLNRAADHLHDQARRAGRDDDDHDHSAGWNGPAHRVRNGRDACAAAIVVRKTERSGGPHHRPGRQHRRAERPRPRIRHVLAGRPSAVDDCAGFSVRRWVRKKPLRRAWVRSCWLVNGVRSGNRFLRGAAGFPPRSRPLTGPDRPTDLNPTKTVYPI
jgi:hypothetical protein